MLVADCGVVGVTAIFICWFMAGLALVIGFLSLLFTKQVPIY